MIYIYKNTSEEPLALDGVGYVYGEMEPDKLFLYDSITYTTVNKLEDFFEDKKSCSKYTIFDSKLLKNPSREVIDFSLSVYTENNNPTPKLNIVMELKAISVKH